MGRYRIGWNRQGARWLIPALAALAVAGPASAEAPVWTAVDASTGRVIDIDGLQALALRFPDSGSVRLRLLNAYLDAGRRADAAQAAAELIERGYVFSAGAQEMLLGLDPTDRQLAVFSLQESKATPIEASRALTTLPAEALLVEGVALDKTSGRLFASTIVSRGLYELDGEGRWRRLPLAKPSSLAGMALDNPRHMLWVASGAYDQTPANDPGEAGIFGVNLETGEVSRKVAPGGATPADIALGPDGTLYASDPLSGAIYFAGPQIWQLWPLVAPGTFRSPQGIVPWEGGLIVSDYAYGLAFVDSAGNARRIEAAVPMLLDGIDGMWRRGDEIIAIQNGARPPRIISLTMSPDGTRVTALRVLERAQRAWTEPTGGALVGDDLIYIATGQWDRFGDGGVPSAENPPVPTEIRILPLNSR
jgi:hypothetical protein